MSNPVIKVAVPAPLNRLFDYLPPSGNASQTEILPGQRVNVPFGRRTRTGVVISLAQNSDVPLEKLRHIQARLDQKPVFDEKMLNLLNWAANYYRHPPGEVYAAALPAALRKGANPEIQPEWSWSITTEGRAVDLEALTRKASAQALLLKHLLNGPAPEDQLRELHSNWSKIVRNMAEKGWLRRTQAQPNTTAVKTETGPELTKMQKAAINQIKPAGFECSLLQGVTGSGKTEVYLRLINGQIAAGRQSLILVPEIGLTPQLIEHFRRRINGSVVVMHSGLTDNQRLESWVNAYDGNADVIIGTRSAIFTPLPRPGLIVIDEEHDSSFKQQDGFRYSARDLAVYRARQLDIPVVLGSATPSFETLNNALEGRYQHLHLPERPGSAQQPDIHTIDLRQYALQDGLSRPFIEAMHRHLKAGNQVLIYLNRRGFAPTLLCPECGDTEECHRCDARMVIHQRRNRLVCHHCGAERPRIETCKGCGSELVAVGLGTERLEEKLLELFPNYPLVRIDRDTTRKRGAMENMLQKIRSGETRILLGTQMLTKGHDFPNVTCVGIVDSDQGLFGTDFRSSERLAQSILQVAGRAGRAEKHGEVWLQTLHPDHPLLTTLLTAGYDAFAEQALAERRSAAWPPFTHLALLRAECAQREQLFRFLNHAADCAPAADENLRLLGPASSPMEKRSGRFRGQLLIQSNDRSRLNSFLQAWQMQIDQLAEARKT
ncbi:MAG: primosomal protein N', partial [Gammaproteobacteria bacterium]